MHRTIVLLLKNNRKLQCRFELHPELFYSYKCAVTLAKLGGVQMEQIVKLFVPPDEVIDDMIEDIQAD